MSDEIYLEMAEANVLAQAENQIAQAHAKALPDLNLTPENYLTRECEECEDPLPEFRMQKGLRLCVVCQTRLEQKRR